MRLLLLALTLLVLLTASCNGPRRGYGASDSTEDVLVMVGASERNGAFKFYDAADGCPSYRDGVNRKYMGMVKAKEEGAPFPLPVGTPVHVFLFSPKDTQGILTDFVSVNIYYRSLCLVIKVVRAFHFFIRIRSPVCYNDL